MPELKTLPLAEAHLALHARFGEFAGWRMPLWYRGALDEHKAVRNSAGIFDISHMGRFALAGGDAGALLASCFSRDPRSIEAGASLYCLACNDSGGIMDDLIVYRRDDTRWYVICNAANAGKIGALLHARAGDSVTVSDAQTGTVLLAVQGPEANERTANVLGPELLKLPRHRSLAVQHDGATYFCSRSGYTGEDGFEVMTGVDAGRGLWQRLIEEQSCLPCGLAARDSLRLEASLPLHGADIDETTRPWAAGLGWAVELEHEFPGREALAASRGRVEQRLACIVSDGAGVMRSHQDLLHNDQLVAHLTSGGFSPMLERSIGMAYLPRELAIAGATLDVDLRGRRVSCHIVKRPFYTSPDLQRQRTEAKEPA